VPAKGFDHQVTVLKGKKESASELMPRVHRVASLLKRWLLGTHQGAVSREQLDYYLDEFTFRFNRRRSKSRGKLFYRLVQQAVEVDPVPYKAMVKCFAAAGEGNHDLSWLPASSKYPTISFPDSTTSRHPQPARTPPFP
jgi:hypothetical protein